ncbi:VWFA domain-containing protein [Candidatus Electrothrix laxa]
MINKHKQEGIFGLRTAAALLLFSLVTAGQALGEQGNDSLLATMQARQAQLDDVLKDTNHCLGERLDGLLEINTNCTAEERTLAEQENRDRQELHRQMSEMLGISPSEIGEERAKRYADRYVQGVQREVRISASETTWWDGYPPDPRKTAVSRILTLQHARLHERPDADSPVVRDNVQQYEAFGVVGSTEDNTGERWYQITDEYVPKTKPQNWSPNPIGWVTEKKVIPWRRAVVMRFTNPLHREPSLFFKKPEPVIDLMEKSQTVREQNLQTVREDLENGRENQSGVIAMEPHVGTGQEQMVMYPVLDFYASGGRDDLRIDGKFARLLEVAARTRNGESEGGNGSVAIDIVFVMDTTNSMKPYLENVLAATEEFAKAHTDDALRFGFIGYQDDGSQFAYTTKEFTTQTVPADKFVRTLAQVKAREYPAKGDDIPEAVFEGVDAALDSGQWRKDAIKIVFLVGDAPGKEKLLNSTILRDKASVRQIRLFAFHLKNSAVSKNWDNESRKQYTQLSSFLEGSGGSGQAQNYLRTVDAGAAQFRQVISEQFLEAQQALDNMRNIINKGGELSATTSGSLNELIFQQAALLLADKSLPQDEVRGWVSDKVLTNPDREALVPMILLTETELEELDARVRELKDIGEKALRGDGGTTLDFFDLVSKNTRFTMVDPAAVNFRDAFSVPLGISNLPYKSDIMAASRDDFESPDRVQDFVRAMDNKLRHYEDLRRKRGDSDVWKKLSAGAQDRDRVVGVELNQLP